MSTTKRGSNGGDVESTEPLLEKSSQPEEEEEISSQNYGPIGYNHEGRFFQDIAFLIVFLILVLSTFAFGIFAIAHRNGNYGNLESYVYFKNSSSCTKTSSLSTDPFGRVSTLGDKKLEFHGKLGFHYKLEHSGELGLRKLRSDGEMGFHRELGFQKVWNVAYEQLVFIKNHAVIEGTRHRIELAIRILQTASEGLARNIRLLVVLPSLTAVLCVYFVPIIVFLSFARLNGKIIPNPKVVESGYACGVSTGVDCCLWKQDRWVPAYYALAIITMIWSATTMIEAQVYIISGTLAQWYFHRADCSPPRGIRNSVRNAFLHSFGSVCFSGLIFGVVRIVRAAVDSARREGKEGVLYAILRCCVNSVLWTIESVNKFTINFAAITGKSYCSSAKMSYELLKRNLLSAAVVETISYRILFGISFVVTVIYAIVVCAILKAATSLGGDAYFVMFLAWALLFMILLFFTHILDNAIDTIYICYAIDKDKRDVSKSEVHGVFIMLPVSRNESSVFPLR
ncbi:hypothetical protein SUGI_1180160 [Cryptomeria japonica]|nr:hypothetical protein SUGI_1180160 [Cryptomeria japonica]